MGVTYKQLVRQNLDKTGGVNRFVRIKSYGLKLSDMISLFDTDDKSPSNLISNFKAKVDGTSTTYYFPLPSTIDDDSSQSWDKSGIMSDVMSLAANKLKFLQAYTGVGIQPHYSQTYLGQVPRTITMNFLINVENEEDFTEINKMLLNLKYDMTPGLPEGEVDADGNAITDSGNLSATTTEAASYVMLPPPRLFDIQFGRKDSHINKIIKYDLCALQNMDISYGTDGFMGLHTGALPKYISINMTFAEFEPKEKGDWTI